MDSSLMVQESLQLHPQARTGEPGRHGEVGLDHLTSFSLGQRGDPILFPWGHMNPTSRLVPLTALCWGCD